VYECGDCVAKQQTINSTVYTYKLMKFDVSLQSLSEAEDFAHNWLEATAHTAIAK